MEEINISNFSVDNFDDNQKKHVMGGVPSTAISANDECIAHQLKLQSDFNNITKTPSTAPNYPPTNKEQKKHP